MKTLIKITVPADILADLLAFIALPEKDQDAILKLMETAFDETRRQDHAEEKG